MALSWKKTKGEISYFASVTDDGVVCGEAGDDPHGVNSECRCTRQSWLARDGDGGRCRQIIADNFGAEAVAQIDAALAR